MDSLAIGAPEIDAQHKALFEAAARFEAAAEALEPYDRLTELLASIVELAVEHFHAEERLMRGVGYPRLSDHFAEHAYVKQRFRSLVPRWESEGASEEMVRVVLGFLDLWLNTHIAHSDRQIGDFIRE
jgi:hemerythrin-like metal-binding protein